MDEFERLDYLLARIKSEIKVKQEEVFRLTIELQKLQEHAKAIDKTRAMLISTMTAADSYSRKLVSQPPASLQEEIAKCLVSVGDAGVTLGGVVNMLTERGYPNSDSKSFYPSVFTTLKRLVAKGKVIEFPVENKKHYKLADLIEGAD